ncbi:MAG TPA: hypothetical protein VEI01_06985 [Terriglobales bacterium]|nr:hypothetical protein [Terriglobales bacterium]
MRRNTKLGGFAVTVILGLNMCAIAQDTDGDRDDYYRSSPAEAQDSGYQNGYQQGSREGFQSGFASVAFRGPDGARYSGSVGYQIGYQDGTTVAREDLAKNKRFDPNPRGPYNGRDHGYRREYGDKGYYQQLYTDGYRAGYRTVFDRRR